MKSALARLFAGKTGPVPVVVLTIIAIWYVAAIFMNATWQRDVFARAGTDYTTTAPIAATWTLAK